MSIGDWGGLGAGEVALEGRLGHTRTQRWGQEMAEPGGPARRAQDHAALRMIGETHDGTRDGSCIEQRRRRRECLACIVAGMAKRWRVDEGWIDRKSTRLNSSH